MLHELAKLNTGAILASSGSEGGFANRAVIKLLKTLPGTIEFWHFGDSDPKGFDILRDLRERLRRESDREIHSLHMHFRPQPDAPCLDSPELQDVERLLASSILTDSEKSALLAMREANSKGAFEQESLGRPAAEWPHYSLAV